MVLIKPHYYSLRIIKNRKQRTKVNGSYSSWRDLLFRDPKGSIRENITDLLNTLERETTLILNWVRKNEMKPNDDKCHLIICNQEDVSVTRGNERIKNADSVELLGLLGLIKS